MALQEEFESQGNFLFRHRSNLPLIIVLVGLSVFIFDSIYGNKQEYVSYAIVEYFSLLVSLLGLIIRIYTVAFTLLHSLLRTLLVEIRKQGN